MICTKIKTFIPCFYFHRAFKSKIFINAEIVTRENPFDGEIGQNRHLISVYCINLPYANAPSSNDVHATYSVETGVFFFLKITNNKVQSFQFPRR